MSDREAFAAAMSEERDIDQWQVRDIIWDLEGCTETVSTHRDVIAHVLWQHGVTPDYLGECRADEESSVYENECQPCIELLLAIADRVLSRVALGAGSTAQDHADGSL